MSEIQQARDVLTKARKASRAAGPQARFWSTGDLDTPVKHLAMLTAGNPDLLDAIDEVLALGAEWAAADGTRSFPSWMQNVAAAIIAADERINA